MKRLAAVALVVGIAAGCGMGSAPHAVGHVVGQYDPRARCTWTLEHVHQQVWICNEVDR